MEAMGEVMGRPMQDKELLASGSGQKINILEEAHSTHSDQGPV